MGVCLIHIFMDLVEGQDLDRAWEGFDKDTKERVAGQLKGYLAELVILER